MRPSAGSAVTPPLRVWMMLPAERRAAAVTLLAMLAARAAAGPAGGGRGEPGRVPAVGPVAGEDPCRAPGPGGGGVVRQPGRQQVLEHSESTRLQYALVERASALGWARSRIVVIDDDLGVSAATADARAGFARLVTEVTMGRVGIVLGIEISRLARTGRDWHQLLELCSLAGVLLADPDGVYDPGFYNDRLLLGLSDLDQLRRCEWPGHDVDDARL